MVMRKLLVSLVLGLFTLSCFAQSLNFTEGKNALKNNDLNTALDYFNKDVQDNPTNSLTYYYRAWVFYKKSLYAKALNDINTGIQNVTKKQKRLKGGFYELKAKVSIELDETDNAIRYYTAAIKWDPKDNDFYAGRAQAYYTKNQLDKSESDYRIILKMDETNDRAYAGLGRNYIAQKRYKDADEILKKLKKLHPQYGAAYYYSAKSLYEQGKYDKAIEDIFQAFIVDDMDDSYFDKFLTYAEKNYDLALCKITNKIKEEPDNYDWPNKAGILLMNNAEYFGAIKYFTQAIDLKNESDEYMLTRRGQCFLNAGLLSLALNDFNQSLSKDSTFAINYIFRAEAKNQLEKYPEAKNDFDKAIELKPDESWYYYRRASLYSKTRDYIAALNDYNKSIRIDNSYAYSYLYRGRLYKQKLDESQKATADFKNILLLDTAIINSGGCRHYALFELGRLKEAVSWMDKILEVYPNKSNYYDAACLYSLMNKADESIRYLTLSFENGYTDISHINTDEDLDNVRNQATFKMLLDKWKPKIEIELHKLTSKQKNNPANNKENMTQKSTTIPLRSKGSGTYEVACRINDLPLNFIFDTGASDISISQTEVQFMLKNNYLKSSDVLGSQKYMDANGNIEIGTKIMLRKVEIGDIQLSNVSASVVNNNKAPLLFGQSALSKYGKILIDNEKKTISISK